MKNIKIFESMTGFKYIKGEIGFGRPCVKITHKLPDDDDYCVAYSLNDLYPELNIYHSIANSCKPEDAYHKGYYLAVLIHTNVLDARKQLDKWLGCIIAAGFKVVSYKAKRGEIIYLVHPGIILKAITNKETQ